MVTCHKSSSSSDKIIMTKQNCKSPPTNNPPPPPTRAAPAAAVAAKARQLIANNNYNNDNHDVFSGTPVAKRRGECYSPPMPPPSSISSTSKANANSKTRSKKSPTTASGSAAIGSGKKSHKRQKHYEEIVKEIKKIMARNPQTRRKLRYLARKQRVQETVPTLSFAEEVLGGAGAACATPEHDDDKLLQLLQEEDSPPPPIIRLPALSTDKIKTSVSSVSRKPIEEKKSLSLTMEKNVPTTTTTTTTAPLLNFAANTDNRLVLESRSPSPALPLHRDDEDTFIKEDMTKHQLLLMKNIKSLEKSQAVAAAAAAVDLRPKFTGNFKFTDRFMANEQQQQPQLNQHQHHSNNLTIKSKPLITLPNFSTLNSSVVNAAKEVESRKSNENCAYPLHILGPRIQSKLFPQTMTQELPAAAAAVVEGPLLEKAPAKKTTSSLSRLLEVRSPAKQQLRSPARRSPLSSPRPRSRSRSVSREATAAPAKDRSPSRDSLNSPPRPRNNCNDLELDHDRDEDDDEDYHHHHHHDEHCSPSTRSSRSGGSCTDRSSRSRSSTRSSRSPSIPRRYGSPSFLDRRRITSARKRPIPYHRPTPSPSSSVDSSHSDDDDDDDSSPSSSHHHNSHSDDAWSQKSYKSI